MHFALLATPLALGTQIKTNPFIAIFGVSLVQLGINSLQSEVSSFTSLLARRRILLLWKSPKPPSISLWLKDVMFFLRVEKMLYSELLFQ